jgi:hypothetical protein
MSASIVVVWAILLEYPAPKKNTAHGHINHPPHG